VGALRRNVRTLLRTLDGAELWAVVKATRTATARSSAPTPSARCGSHTLCVATVPEALALRDELPAARLLVLAGLEPRDRAGTRCRLLRWSSRDDDIPEGVAVHVKLDTGMGRWGTSELNRAGA